MKNRTVNGDISASEKPQLGRTARVMGNIQSPGLIVEEGAIIEGGCSMLKARETQEEEEIAAGAVQYEEPAPISSYSSAAVDEEEEETGLFSTDDDEKDEDEEAADAATV